MGPRLRPRRPGADQAASWSGPPDFVRTKRVAEGDKAETPESRAVRLTEAEVEVLLKACRKYRASLAVYLKSGEAEAKIIDGIIRKLS